MAYSFSDHWKLIKKPDIEVEVRGETFTLPPDLPVSFYMLQVNPDEDMTVLDMEFTLLTHLFTKEVVDGWVSSGMSGVEYKELVSFVAGLYKPKEGEEGDADDPKEEPSS